MHLVLVPIALLSMIWRLQQARDTLNLCIDTLVQCTEQYVGCESRAHDRREVPDDDAGEGVAFYDLYEFAPHDPGPRVDHSWAGQGLRYPTTCEQQCRRAERECVADCRRIGRPLPPPPGPPPKARPLGRYVPPPDLDMDDAGPAVGRFLCPGEPIPWDY